MTGKLSEYEVKTLQLEEKTYGKMMTFRNAIGKTYIQYPWIKCSRFVVPDDKFCKEVKERACVRMPTPSDPEFVSYLNKLDDYLTARSSRANTG